MSFYFDSKGSNVLSGDPRSTAGTFSQDGKSQEGVTWQTDLLMWSQELRTWAQAGSQLTLDTKH